MLGLTAWNTQLQISTIALHRLLDFLCPMPGWLSGSGGRLVNLEYSISLYVLRTETRGLRRPNSTDLDDA